MTDMPKEIWVNAGAEWADQRGLYIHGKGNATSPQTRYVRADTCGCEGLVKALDAIEKIAFEIPPANPYTPKIVQLVQYCKTQIAAHRKAGGGE